MPSSTWNGHEWVVIPVTKKCPNCGKRVLPEAIKRLSTGEYRCNRCTRT